MVIIFMKMSTRVAALKTQRTLVIISLNTIAKWSSQLCRNLFLISFAGPEADTGTFVCCRQPGMYILLNVLRPRLAKLG